MKRLLFLRLAFWIHDNVPSGECRRDWMQRRLQLCSQNGKKVWQFRCTVNMFWVQLHLVYILYGMITFNKYQERYWSDIVTESMGVFCWTLSPNRSTCFYKASIDILVSLLWILDWQPWLGSASNSIYIEYEDPFLDPEL